MADTRINDASWDLVEFFHDTNQAVMDTFVAVQDHHVKFVQNLFLIGIETVESQTEYVRHLMDWWTQQLPKQQEAFQKLMNTTLDVSMNFLSLPFSPQVSRNVTGAERQPAIPGAVHTTRQALDAAGSATQRELAQAQLWSFEQPLEEAECHRSVLIRVKAPGRVYAGVNREGKWIRMYDIPLQEVSPGVWEAYVRDPEVNEFTFLWHDPNGSGNVHWEGKNYLLARRLDPRQQVG